MNGAFGPVILVVGMHRSGTSAVTRVLNLLGVALGGSLLAPADDNVRGFWEHRDVVLIHERLLNALNRSWFDLRALPDGWLATPAAAEAKLQLKELFTREFAGKGMWAVKDPRICRLLPLWRSVMEELDVKTHVLFVVRHANEVAESLLARDGISRDSARLSWVQHLAEAEISSRGIPRSVLLYEDLLAHWARNMARVASELAIRWPNDISSIDTQVRSFLEPADRHHSAGVTTTVALPRLIQEINDAFVSVAHGVGSWSDVSSLSDVYDEVAESFLAPLEDLASRVDGGMKVPQDAEAPLRALVAQLDARLEAVQDYIACDKLIDDAAKLYFRAADQSHAEDRVVVVKHDGLATVRHIRFELPVVERIDFLRFDPSEVGGVFDILELKLDDVIVENMERYVAVVNQSRLAPTADGSLRIASADNDPYIEFAVGALRRSAAFVTCTIGVRRESLHDRMRDVFVNATSLAVTQHVDAGIEHIRVTLEPLRQSIQTICERHAVLDKVQAHHGVQPGDLALLQQQSVQHLDSLRVQAEELTGLGREARGWEDRHQTELDSLRIHVEELTDLAREARGLENQHKAELGSLRVQVDELTDLGREVRGWEDRHQTELDSLQKTVLAQSACIDSWRENAEASEKLVQDRLDVLVKAYDRTFSAKWHRWSDKRREK